MADTQAPPAQDADSADAEDQESPDAGPAPAFDPKKLESLVRELRAENAKTRVALRTAQTRLQAQDEAGLSELQRAQKQAKDLEAEVTTLRQERRAGAFREAFAAAGAIYPDLLLARVPADADPEDAAKLVREQRRAYPDLFRAAGSDGAAGGATGTSVDMNAQWRRQIQALRRG